MQYYYWIDGYIGWGWILWFGIVFLLLSSIANWGFNYRARQKYDTRPLDDSMVIRDERYVRGAIEPENIYPENYGMMKSDHNDVILANENRM